jgi:hypothetical protein
MSITLTDEPELHRAIIQSVNVLLNRRDAESQWQLQFGSLVWEQETEDNKRYSFHIAVEGNPEDPKFAILATMPRLTTIISGNDRWSDRHMSLKIFPSNSELQPIFRKLDETALLQKLVDKEFLYESQLPALFTEALEDFTRNTIP